MLAQYVSGEHAKTTIDAWNRVCNLAAKAESDQQAIHLFIEPVEQELYKVWEKLHILYNAKLQEGQESDALAELASLRDPINRYFETVMVMAEDPELRAARLALLKAISNDIKKFADFSRIVW